MTYTMLIKPTAALCLKGLVFAAWLLMLPACAVVSPPSGPTRPAPAETAPAQNIGAPSYWWFVQVKMAWPGEQPVAWHMDALLAHRVFKPLLLAHAHDIELWRFHRRAGKDAPGHRFSFIFYAPQAAARAILDGAAQNPLLARFAAANVIDNVRVYEANTAPDPAIEATSDKNWSPAMQRAWPYFAMGVSQAWLSLIDQHVASTANNWENLPEETDIEAMMRFYRQIESKMAATWETEGGHALLHHLNALFGYGEVAIYERRMIRF